MKNESNLKSQRAEDATYFPKADGDEERNGREGEKRGEGGKQGEERNQEVTKRETQEVDKQKQQESKSPREVMGGHSHPLRSTLGGHGRFTHAYNTHTYTHTHGRMHVYKHTYTVNADAYAQTYTDAGGQSHPQEGVATKRSR